jgi:hypothetical protein
MPAPPTTPALSARIGSAEVSSTIDSTSYTIAAGNSVTFTVALMGNGGTPSGTVSFSADGKVIADCANVAVANGKARCTTSRLNGGQLKITGAYAGDATYGTGLAGPITQTVTGTLVATAESGNLLERRKG